MLRMILVVAAIFVAAMYIIGVASKNESPETVKPAEPKEAVFNSSWDGSVRQVKSYLGANLKDPKSFEAIEWGVVTKKDATLGGGYIVRVKYRARNGFGGMGIEHQLFHLDNEGNVLAVYEWGK